VVTKEFERGFIRCKVHREAKERTETGIRWGWRSSWASSPFF